MRYTIKCLLPFCLLIAGAIAALSQDPTVRQIMAEPSIAGMRVEGEKLSPDGAKVAYLWNADGKMPRDLYMVRTSGGTPTKLLSPRDLPVPVPSPTPENKLAYGLTIRDDFVKSRENQIGNLEWSPDSKKILFVQAGDIYVLTFGETKPKRYTKTQTAEIAARFLDNDRILFSQSGNLFVLNTADSTLTQISKEANPQSFITVANVTPNKAGTLVAYVVSDGSKQKALVVPNYLDEFTATPSVRRGWTEQKILVVPADGSRDAPFEIKLPKAEGVSSIRRMVWAADNSSLIIDRNDKDTKRRQLYYIHDVGSKGEQTILITEETDDKWIGQPSIIVEPNPKDPGQILFGSERDGFHHLYLATLEQLKPEPNPTGEIRGEGDPGYSSKVKIEQVTKGNWQVEWAKWNPGVSQIIYLSTEKGPSERTFSIVTTDGKKIAPFEDVANTRPFGMIGSPQMASDDSKDLIPQLIYENSKWNEPGEFYALKLCLNCSANEEFSAPIRLIRTIPEGFSERNWNAPKFLEIASRDGKKIPTKIYLPTGHKPNSKTRYPMVVFVHGAGYLQNVINGWNNYYREFMFNQLLAQKGYVVLDIDYRGSAGYGRDWRTDVYDFLGGRDYDDHIDAIDFMVKNYAVNPSKVGVYGGSYGGFMAAMLAMRAPDKIAAAAALRPVFDWKNYYAASPGYAAQRLGFPDKNPKAYERSSPISYADKLERPLLILHGMADDNVHVQDSVQLIEKLIRLGKTQYFEAMLYPSENHGFVRPESWTDEYERILAFFEKHLK